MQETITRARELKPHISNWPEVERLIIHVESGESDAGDDYELREIVGAYELFRSPKVVKERVHCNLFNNEK